MCEACSIRDVMSVCLCSILCIINRLNGVKFIPVGLVREILPWSEHASYVCQSHHIFSTFDYRLCRFDNLLLLCVVCPSSSSQSSSSKGRLALLLLSECRKDEFIWRYHSRTDGGYSLVFSLNNENLICDMSIEYYLSKHSSYQCKRTLKKVLEYNGTIKCWSSVGMRNKSGTYSMVHQILRGNDPLEEIQSVLLSSDQVTLLSLIIYNNLLENKTSCITVSCSYMDRQIPIVDILLR